MSKKTGLQVLMVLIIILISLWFYLKYFSKNFEDVKETQVIEKIDENQNSTSTYIDDIIMFLPTLKVINIRSLQ